MGIVASRARRASPSAYARCRWLPPRLASSRTCSSRSATRARRCARAGRAVRPGPRRRTSRSRGIRAAADPSIRTGTILRCAAAPNDAAHGLVPIQCWNVRRRESRRPRSSSILLFGRAYIARLAGLRLVVQHERRPLRRPSRPSCPAAIIALRFTRTGATGLRVGADEHVVFDDRAELVRAVVIAVMVPTNIHACANIRVAVRR